MSPLLAVIFPMLLLGGPTTVPSTGPSTAPARSESLAGGMIRFLIPDGLTLLGKRTDDLSASMAPPDGSALITLVVAPQQSTIDDHLASKLGKLVIKTINDQAAKGEIESLSPPKVEADDRFLLRVHDRFRAHGKTGDRVQLYRGVGKFLTSVTATSFSDDAPKSKSVHEQGESLALSVALNRAARNTSAGGGATTTKPAPAPPPAARPITLTNAKLRITPPPGWTGETNDNASGIIATWRDPNDRNNLIAVSVRQIPKEARSDPKLRDAIVDEIVAGEKQAFVIDGAEPRGQAQTITDKRFLRKTRTDYQAKGVKFRISARQIRAGDVILSVTMLALDEQADAIDALADKVALDARALGPLPK